MRSDELLVGERAAQCRSLPLASEVLVAATILAGEQSACDSGRYMDGKRENDACGSPEVVLLGDPPTTPPLWAIWRAALARGADSFTVPSRAQAGIDDVIGRQASAS